MQNFVLFSAIGGHDPIATMHDGACLHICRIYHPSKIYLFLTSEMLLRSQKDDRYCQTIRLLYESMNLEMPEIILFERPELTDVHLFDAFYLEFDKIICDILIQNPKASLLLNLSSGTPAMKSALNVISTLSPVRMTAIQVATPARKENSRTDLPHDYDVSLYWECNEDQDPYFINRCQELESIHLMAKIQKEMIVRFIEQFDYQAALSIAEDMESFLSPSVMDNLRFACDRFQLSAKMHHPQFMLSLPVNQNRIFEYMLILQIKAKQGNYADFIRALSPIILDLFELCFQNECKIDFRTLCKVKKRNKMDVYYMSEAQMGGSTIKQACLKALEEQFGSPLREVPYGAVHILCILRKLSSSDALVQTLDMLRSVEENVRNVTAHEIVSVIPEWVKKYSGYTVEDILKALRKAFEYAGITVPKKEWSSYENMNQAIIKSLDEISD